MHIQTILGEVSTQEISLVLPHEHLFINLMKEYRGVGLLHDPAVAIEECRRLLEVAATPLLVDCTTQGAGRFPALMQVVAESLPLHIVAGAGFYRDPYLDTVHINASTVEMLADEIVQEVEEGVEGTSLQAGVIGEVGSDTDRISAIEERCLRAAARAHHRTGVSITTHAARWPSGIPQAEIFRTEGVPPERIIIGHADSVPDPKYTYRLAEMGVYLQFDLLAHTLSDWEVNGRVEQLTRLKSDGYLSKLMVSHDVCLRTNLSINGGKGYTYVSTDFSDKLRAVGWSEEEIRQLTRDNPLAALTGHSVTEV